MMSVSIEHQVATLAARYDSIESDLREVQMYISRNSAKKNVDPAKNCMKVTINNCNNIRRCKMTLSKGLLNIKFGLNGSGKSTIARAIQHTVNKDEEHLDSLLPFRLRESNPNDEHPSVDGVGDIDSVMCFDEEYVEQFTFQKDELVRDSFNIFIKNENYAKKQEIIKTLVGDIQQKVCGNAKLECFISCLQRFSKAFKFSRRGLSMATRGMMGLSSGNKVRHIPFLLFPYKRFIQSNHADKWVDWHIQGSTQFSGLSAGCCPFCAGNSRSKTVQISHVSRAYTKALVGQIVDVNEVLRSMGYYVKKGTQKSLLVIMNLKSKLKSRHECFLAKIKQQVDDLLARFNALKNLNAFTFNHDSDIRKTLKAYRIDADNFPNFCFKNIREAVESLNSTLDALISNPSLIGNVKGIHVNMRKLIHTHEEDINKFLSTAGYRYEVKVTGEGEQCRLQLRHPDCSNAYLSGGSQHLSYGERNALAVVLFMYDCLAQRPSLIVLDDPISSFDQNKKFAILDMLFIGSPNKCLKGKTVLMMTHDLEPIIDTLKVLKRPLGGCVKASYQRNRAGRINDTDILEGDLVTFAQICMSVIESQSQHILIKLVFLRRHYEILNNKGCDAYEVLSNALHLRQRNEATDSREQPIRESVYPVMDQDKFDAGCRDIAERIPGFDYGVHPSFELSEVRDVYNNCQNSYYKLPVFRLMPLKESKNVDNVLRKFVNATCHIENEYTTQLNPEKFDLVPEYIIAECNRLVQQGTT